MKLRPLLLAPLALANLACPPKVGTLPDAGPRCEPSSQVPACLDPAPEPPETDRGCDNRSFVGFLPANETACPTSAGWRVRDRFAAVPRVDRPAELPRYCEYTADDPAGPRQGQVEELGRVASGLRGFGQNCTSVAVLNAITSTMSPAQWASWRGLAEAEGPLAGQPSRIRVAVIDSAPTGYDSGKAGQPGTLPHGRNVGRAIREVSCPSDGEAGQPCAGFVASHQALALPGVNGAGAVGTQGALAEAIYDSVTAFFLHQVANPPGSADPHERLIINLSVGWEGTGRATPNAVPDSGGPRMVYDALLYARCNGATIIAAAGNRGLGPREGRGPMYPAAWEVLPTPEEAACARLGQRYPGRLANQQRAPLVYAVGGVDDGDLELAITRPNGVPRLVAPAMHIVSGDQGGYTEPLTGTSMAAAITSGIAATVWGYAPGLSPAELMELVYSSGQELGGGTPWMADFTLGSLDRRVRRVSRCRALDAACAASPGPACASLALRCPSANAHAPGRKLPKWSLDTEAWVSAEMAPEQSGAAIVHEHSVTACGGNVVTELANVLSPRPCPDKLDFGYVSRPWVYPQPSTPHCPDCAVAKLTNKTSAVYIWTGNYASTTKIGNLVVILTSASGQPTYFDISKKVGNLGPNASAKVTDLATDYTKNTWTKASLSFNVISPEGTFAGVEQLQFWQ